MKKLILILNMAGCLVAYQAFGQTTIGVSGTNEVVSLGTTSVSDPLTLTINGTNTIGTVESVNMLLRTGSTGGSNGASFFTIGSVTPTSPYTLTNSNPSNVAFNTAGDAANSGTTVSTPTSDLGSNAPAGSAPSVASSGTTTIPFENINFSLAPNTPAGVYSFSVTLGGLSDSQGSWIDNTNSATFDINSAPTFTITVVPEPATLSLLGLSGLGSFGLTVLRARRKIS